MMEMVKTRQLKIFLRLFARKKFGHKMKNSKIKFESTFEKEKEETSDPRTLRVSVRKQSALESDPFPSN